MSIATIPLLTTAAKFQTLDDLLVRAYALSDDLTKDENVSHPAARREMHKVRRRLELAMLHAIRINTSLRTEGGTHETLEKNIGAR